MILLIANSLVRPGICNQASAAFAQEGGAGGQALDLFSYPTQHDLAAFTDKQADRLRAFRADPTAAEVRVVSLQFKLLRNLDSVNLNLTPGQKMPLDVVRVEQRSASDYSWFGSSSTQAEDEAILVIQDDQAYGNIRSDGQLYRVRPLDGGLHVLIRVDETKFPPEHPPEFEEMERDTERDVRGQMPAVDAMQDACTEYTAVIAYTAGAKSQAGNIDALIQLAVDETNQGYTNSGVNTRIKVAHKYQTSYTESTSMTTDRNRFRDKDDGFMDDVHSKRDEYAADVALLITQNGDYCGIAAGIGATAATAFAVVGQNCATGYYSFAHEIGHLQGGRHNTQADSTNTPFPYGHGYYYEPGDWRTVMSYNCPGGCTRLKYWSNPSKSYGGVAMGTASTNNNTRVLNETACTVANFRTSVPLQEGPLAFGVVMSNGTKYSGTPNWSSTYNANYKRYEIEIDGESYYYLKYATTVTPAGDIRYCRSTSVGGQLLVYCYDKNGNAATSRFAFVTFKPN